MCSDQEDIIMVWYMLRQPLDTLNVKNILGISLQYEIKPKCVPFKNLKGYNAIVAPEAYT